MHTLALSQARSDLAHADVAHLAAAPFDSHRAPQMSGEAGQGGVVVGLVNVLAARYPVVRRLAGEQSFLGAARGYVFTRPPRSPNLTRYGETFPHFLRSLGSTASIDYLADIAELESAHHKARHASHRTAVDVRTLASRSLERLRASRVGFHPSMSVVASRYPIVTVWEANRTDGEPSAIVRWNAEAALVARPLAGVEIRRLPAGGIAFFGALLAGATIGDAVAAGNSDAPDFDADANLAVLAESQVAVEVR